MESNVGTIDRAIRITGGIILIWLGFQKIRGFLGFLIGALGADEVAAGIVGWCWLFYLLRISSVERAENNPFKAIKEAIS